MTVNIQNQNTTDQNAAGNHALQIEHLGEQIARNIAQGDYEEAITHIDQIQQHLNSLRHVIKNLTGTNHQWLGVQQQSDSVGCWMFIMLIIGFAGGVYSVYSGLIIEVARKINLPF